MFGWEYAPLIAGGLGVVCRALTTSLVREYNTEITYVLPRLPEGFRSKINVEKDKIWFENASLSDEDVMRIIDVESGMSSPYRGLDDNTFAHLRNWASKKTNEGPIYGANLLQEVQLYAQAARDIARKANFDLIHSHDWMTAPAAMAAKQETGKPMVMHIHATEYERTLGNPNPHIFATELAGMEAADKIIAVSEATKQRIVANYGVEPEKIVVVHNALERIESKYGPIAKSVYNDDKIVLFLARLTAMKGAPYLLQAAAKVVKVLPKTKFLFVGSGELLEELIEQSVELGIGNKVTFTGFLPHDQVDRVYRYADVFVMPSVAEPFGLTPLEAIKNGTPVIISKQSGVSEVLQNVLKVDFWDVDEMANKLIAVLKYGVLAEELTNNSKRDLENLSWSEQSKKIIDVYSEFQENFKLNYKN